MEPGHGVVKVNIMRNLSMATVNCSEDGIVSAGGKVSRGNHTLQLAVREGIGDNIIGHRTNRRGS